MSNLRLINETTASSVSALNVTDVFKARGNEKSTFQRDRRRKGHKFR